MDLHKAWKSLDQQNTAAAPSKQELLEAINKESQLPLNALRKRLQVKLGYVVVFTVGYAALALYINNSLVQTLFSFVVAIHIAFIAVFAKELMAMQNAKNTGKNLLRTLQSNYHHVKKVLRYEEWYGMVIFPVIIPAGMLLGQLIANPSADVIISTKRLLLMILLIATVGPLGHLVARKMNKFAFGKYLNQLKQNIEALRSM